MLFSTNKKYFNYLKLEKTNKYVFVVWKKSQSYRKHSVAVIDNVIDQS